MKRHTIFFLSAVLSIFELGQCEKGYGVDHTWDGNDIGNVGKWNVAANWVPAGVPVAGELALFDGSVASWPLALVDATVPIIKGVSYTTTPKAYTINIQNGTLQMDNGGVDNSSLGGGALTQNIQILNSAVLNFNGSNADIGSTGKVSYGLNGGGVSQLNFVNSVAGAAIIDAGFSAAASVNFSGTSSANTATISAQNGSTISFTGTSTPAASTITLDASALTFDRDSLSSINTTASVALSNGSVLSTTSDVGALTFTKLTSANSTDTISIGGNSVNINGSSIGDVINGKITGVGIFAYTGTGNITLANTTNDYSGGTFIENGTVIATTDTLPAGGTVQTQATGTINLNNTVNGTFTGPFQNFGEILYTGSAAAILSGNILQGGDIVVNAPGTGSLTLTGTTITLGSFQVTDGTLSIPFASCPSGSIASGANLILSGTGGTSTSTFANAGTVEYQGTGVSTLQSPGTISGTGNLVVNATGTGQLVLANTNTYSGTTTVQDGILTVRENALPSTNTTTVNAGGFLEFNYNTGGTFSGDITNNGVVFSSGTASTTLTGAISGTGSVQSATTSPASLFLRGNNTYSGGTLVTSGSSLTVHTQNLPTTGIRQINSTGIMIIDNTTADPGYAGSFIDNGTLNINTTADVTFTNVISGTGVVNINSPGQTITFTGLNTYSGATNINTGSLDIAQAAANTNPSLMNIASVASLNLDQAASTVGTYSGGLSGSGTFTVNEDGGTGTVFLTGPMSFTGTTTVLNGTLAGTPTALPLAIAVNSNATVDIEQSTGTGTYAGVVSNNGVGQNGQLAINQLGGTGTVILTGLNTYTGGTTVYNGILQGTISSIQGDIVVNTGAIVDFEQLSGSGTFSGNISGGGGVTVNALGNRLTFTGNNTYSGTTHVLAGELEMLRTTSGTLPSLLKIDSGAILDLEQAASTTGTYSGGTEGTGTLTINHYGNTGTVFLSGPTTFTGQTIVYRGELEAFSTSLPLNVAVSTNALVDIEQSAGTGTYSGVISNNGSGGKGQLAINKHGGIGTVILTGANTYSGGTTVFNGTLQGTTTSLQGNIVVNSGALVDFEQSSGQGIYDDNISGAGGVVINSVVGSTGTVWFRGDNSYTGGTLVSRGTLKGDTRSLQGAITDNATLLFEQNINDSFNGTFLGNGEIKKEGVGRLTINVNSSAFTGTTNVREGRFDLQNTLGGDLRVFLGGIFSGNGSILGDVTVAHGGIIAPGNSPGTLFVGGDYLQESGGIYLAQFNGFGQSSLIDVQGQATLDPGSRLICETGNDDILLNNVYTILSADGGRNGEFTDVNSTNPLVEPIVTYDANHAYVNFELNFEGVAKTFNQRQVANQLDMIPANPGAELQELLQAFASESVLEARSTLTQMAGVQYSNLILVAELANKNFLQRLFDPLRSIITENPCTPYTYCTYQRSFDLWASISGGRAFIHGNGNAPGFRLAGYEIAGGIQSRFARHLTAGAALSYENDSISYRSGGSGKNSAFLGALYALYRPERFYLLGDLTFGYNNNRVKRTIEVGSIRYKPRANPKIYQTTGYVELGTDYGFNKVLVQPFVGLEIGYYSFNGITESGGAPVALSIKGKSKTISHSRLGLHLTTAPIGCGFNMGVDLAWRYRLTSLENDNRQLFLDFGTPFKIEGTPLQRNSFETIVYMSKVFNRNWQTYIEATAEGWDNSFAYNFVFGVKATW